MTLGADLTCEGTRDSIYSPLKIKNKKYEKKGKKNILKEREKGVIFVTNLDGN